MAQQAGEKLPDPPEEVSQMVAVALILQNNEIICMFNFFLSVSSTAFTTRGLEAYAAKRATSLGQ